jgi:hypothetical protein
MVFAVPAGALNTRAENGPGRAGPENSNFLDGPGRAELPKFKPGPVRFP